MATTETMTGLRPSSQHPARPAHARLEQLPAAMTAHDLRNALQSAQAAHDFLKLVVTDQEGGEAVGILGEALYRMTYLVDALRRGTDSSYPAGTCPVSADLDRVLAATLGSYPAVLTDLAPGLRAACAPHDLQRIVDNLLSNATSYGAPPVEIRGRLRAGLIELTVTDQGPGVDPGFVTALFEPYARGQQHRWRPGSGLGLAIVRQLCVANGGSVTFRPRRPHGARFRVTLPSAAR
jgi:two-component system, OmpR family, sensor histidine kinase KdpD